MADILRLASALTAGMLLGLLFFGGLWWTTRNGIAAANPALWFLGSLILRTGAALAGFYFVASGDWRRALACVLGFTVARMIVLPLTGMRPNRVATVTALHHES